MADSSGLLVVAVPVLLLVLAAGAVALGALIDAVQYRAPAAAAALAPVAEAARLLRQRTRGAVPGSAVLGSAILGSAIPLLVAVLQVELVQFDAVPGGIVWLALLQLIALARGRGRAALLRDVWIALPPVLALAAAVIAGRGPRVADVVAAQRDLWGVVTMPVAFLAVLAAAVIAARRPRPALTGAARLVALAGPPALLVAGAAVCVPLFLGGGAGPVLPGGLWLLVKTALLTVLLVVAGRLLPVLPPEALARASRQVLLPLVLLQLLVVALISAGG